MIPSAIKQVNSKLRNSPHALVEEVRKHIEIVMNYLSDQTFPSEHPAYQYCVPHYPFINL